MVPVRHGRRGIAPFGLAGALDGTVRPRHNTDRLSARFQQLWRRPFGQGGSAEILEKGNNVGYDATSGKYVDMVKAGIIDPAKVSRIALQNAASIASLLLTTDLMVTEYDEKAEEEIPGAIR